MALIAYNLIRLSCQEAAQSAGKDLRLMSFKGALDTIVANAARYLRRQKHTRIIREIWQSIRNASSGAVKIPHSPIRAFCGAWGVL